MKKKLLTSIIILTTVITPMITPIVNANANTINTVSISENDNTLSFQSEDAEYSFEIKTIFDSNEFTKFEITENKEKYSLLIDKSGKYIIDNKVYTEDQYFNALIKQQENLNNAKKSKNIKVESLNKILETETSQLNNKIYNTEDTHIATTRCRSCGINPNQAPSTGYNSYKYAGNIKSSKILLATTAGAISAFAGAYTFGVVSLAQAVIASFISGGANYLIGTMVQPVYRKEQAYHKTCNKAVSEKRSFWIEELGQNGPSGKFKVIQHQFYYINPF